MEVLFISQVCLFWRALQSGWWTHLHVSVHEIIQRLCQDSEIHHLLQDDGAFSSTSVSFYQCLDTDKKNLTVLDKNSQLLFHIGFGLAHSVINMSWVKAESMIGWCNVNSFPKFRYLNVIIYTQIERPLITSVLWLDNKTGRPCSANCVWCECSFSG